MSVTLGPFFPDNATYSPTLPKLNLAEDELDMLGWLLNRLVNQRGALAASERYYDAEQRVQDLGLSIPKNLTNLRVPTEWGKVGVDAIEERLEIEGFRYPNQTDVDQDLLDIWTANDMQAESSFAHLDSQIFGRSYVVCGTPDTPNDPPLITIESPMNMTALWDPRMRAVRAALQLYFDQDFASDTYGQEIASLLLPGRTINMARSGGQTWEIQDRDDHGLQFVPVVRLANRQRATRREGQSEITTGQRALIDAATRTLLGTEVAREIFAAPRRYALGVAEEQFKNADGSTASTLQAVMGAIWAIPMPDDQDQMPSVGQFPASDPTAFKTLMDMYAAGYSALAALPPHYLGLLSDGNPASAEAIVENESRLVRRARRKITGYTVDWRKVAMYAIALRDGVEPDMSKLIDVDWVDPGTLTVSAATDAAQKQIASGMVPPTSDVVLKRVGYNAVDRIRLEADRKLDAGASVLAELASSLQAKEARTDVTVARDINPAAAKATAPPNDSAAGSSTRR